jgi:CRP/FNR family cyclic AMP-dependent transcriptional regulator
MTESLSKPTLPTFSWIGHLKEDDRDLLSSYGEFFPGHPGNIIIQEGSQQTEVFVVISGMLEVRAKQEDGTEIVLAQVGPGETLGEISLFVPGPAAATVTAVEFSQLWRIADADLNHFMEENPGAGNVLLRTLASILAQRLRQMNPLAFGLSTYAVIDSSEDEMPESEPESESYAEIPAAELPAITESAPPPAATLEPMASSPAEPELKSTRLAPPLEVPQTSGGKKLSTKTQIIPDLDELEPI